MKAQVAAALAKRVKDGELIGIGSGSTVELAVEAIGKRVRAEGIKIRAVATSYRSEMLASEHGIEVLSPLAKADIAWAFDGADEVDPEFQMIKGGGAAMLREKIVAKRAKSLVIIVTEEKLVNRLGSTFAIPIEVIPEAVMIVEEGLQVLGASKTSLRQAERKYGPLITERGNIVIDARFESITPELERQINAICGVVENGLFVDFLPELLVAKKDGVWSQRLVAGIVEEERVS